MIQDKDLNALKNGLKAYFKYNPLGPSAMTLSPEMAKKLLYILENLDELRVCRIIRKEDLQFFPNNELMKYVKADMATALAQELIDKGYVKILYEDNIEDPMQQHVYGSVMTIKNEEEKSE